MKKDIDIKNDELRINGLRLKIKNEKIIKQYRQKSNCVNNRCQERQCVEFQESSIFSC